MVGLVLAGGLVTLAGCGGGDENAAQSAPQTPQVGKAKLVRTPAGSPSGVAASIPVNYHPTSGERATHRVQVSGKVVVQDQKGQRHEYTLQRSADSQQSFPQPGRSTLYAHQYLSRADAPAVVGALRRGDDVKVESQAQIGTNTN